MDQTTFGVWQKPNHTWMSANDPIAAPENMKYLSSITLYGAVGNCLKGGKFYMQAKSTSLPETKRFLVELA